MTLNRYLKPQIRISSTFFTCLFIGLMTEVAIGQQMIRHNPPSFIERGESTLLRFESTDIRESEVLEALLFYRVDGSGSYSQQEVRFREGVTEVPLQIHDPIAYSVDYYFVVRTVTGHQFMYSDIIADEAPVTVEIVSPRIESFPTTDLADVAVITPAPDEVVSNEGFFLTAALFYDDAISPDFKLHLNGEDVTEEAEISPFLIKFRRESIHSGDHTVQVLLDEDGSLYEVERWNFRVVRTAITGRDLIFTDQRRAVGGEVELGAGSQYIAGSSTDQLTGRLNVRGREGAIQYSARGYLTTRESSRLQPQNRFNLDMYYNQTAFFRLGDVNPSFSNYSIRGRRVRGVYTGISLWDEKFQLELMRGSLQRSISNRYGMIEVEERDTGFGTEELFFLNLEENGAGAYRRVLTGGRLKVGSRENVQFSMNMLRARDDSTSSKRVRNYVDVLGRDETLLESLTSQQRDYLAQNPEDLQVSATVPTPKENLVVGTEFEFMADQQRVRFHTELAASLLNEDISPGVLSRERAEELGLDLDDNIENLFNSLSWLIIINERMSTLPFKYRESETGATEVDLFLPSSIFASETRVDLRYGAHRIRVDYRWVGPDFQSLANSTVRRDVSGFTITDRFRAMDNRLIFTLGAELLRDNVNNYKSTTLRTRVARASVGWYPFQYNLPRINAGVRYRNRSNSVERFNPFVDEELAASSVRNFEIIDGEIVSATAPRSNVLLAINSSLSQKFSFLEADHEAGLSFNLSDSKSDVNRYGDYRNHSFSLSLRSKFSGRPFETRISLNSTNSSALSGLNEAAIHSVEAGTNWFLLDNRLILNGALSFARSNFENVPLIVQTGSLENSRDDIYVPDESQRESTIANSYRVRLQAEYSIYSSGSLQAMLNYSNVNRRGSDFAALPNDRIMQVRYIHRF